MPDSPSSSRIFGSAKIRLELGDGHGFMLIAFDDGALLAQAAASRGCEHRSRCYAYAAAGGNEDEVVGVHGGCTKRAGGHIIADGVWPG